MKTRVIHLKKMLFSYAVILLLAIMLSMLFFAGYSYYTYQKQIRASSQSMLSLYKYALETKMTDMAAFNQGVYTSNYNFQALASGKASNNEKLLFEYNLRGLISASTPYDGGIFIFDDLDMVNIYTFGSGYSSRDFLRNMETKNKIVNYWRNAKDDTFYNWHLYADDEDSLLMNTYKLNGLYICSMVDLNRVIIDSSTFSDDVIFEVAFYNDTQILSNRDILNKLGVTLNDIQQDKRSYASLTKFITQSYMLENIGIGISSILPLRSYFSSFRNSALLILLVFLLLCIILFLIFHYITKVIIYPTNQIAAVSEKLENYIGNDPLKLSTDSRIYELQKINEALNMLISQKVSLENQNLTRQREKEHAQLQYFQLQTRSHFFNNCLKSLYNMLEMKEYARMQRMIMAFSNHIRFVFHDNLKLITLQSELAEVNDYYNIIMLDRSKPIILLQNVDESILDYLVPPLLIQTFLENSIKYNGLYDKPLRFLIQIDFAELEGEKYLRIRLSDNGKGFSEEMRNKLNNSSMALYEKDHVGISNLKHRIKLIYQEHFRIAFYNNSDGGASVLMYLPIYRNGDNKQ